MFDVCYRQTELRIPRCAWHLLISAIYLKRTQVNYKKKTVGLYSLIHLNFVSSSFGL